MFSELIQNRISAAIRDRNTASPIPHMRVYQGFDPTEYQKDIILKYTKFKSDKTKILELNSQRGAGTTTLLVHLAIFEASGRKNVTVLLEDAMQTTEFAMSIAAETNSNPDWTLGYSRHYFTYKTSGSIRICHIQTPPGTTADITLVDGFGERFFRSAIQMEIAKTLGKVLWIT